MGSRRHAGGFTLLEAIVALVIFTMGAFVLFGWLSSNVITLQRIAERREAGEAVASALELLHGVNPMQAPRGNRAVGSLEIRWAAKPLVPPRTAVTQVGLPTVFEVGLYELQVEVRNGDREIEHFLVRQVGWRQTKPVEFQ